MQNPNIREVTPLEAETMYLAYIPLSLENIQSYPNFNLNLAGTMSNDPGQPPSLLDKHVEKYREAWEQLAEL